MGVLRRPHIGPHSGIRTPNGAFTGGGAPFSPASMTGIQGWYDFSTLAGADGSAIASIADGSANARTLSQATGTKQPLVKAGVNGINGLKVALFDGVDDVLLTGAFAVTQPMTVYAIITGGGAGAQRYWCSQDASLSIRAGYNASNAPDNFAGSSLTGGSINIATPKVVTSVFNGVSSLIRLDRTQVIAGDVGAGNLSSGLAVGAASIAQFFAGQIGELMWTNVATVDTAAELYLKSKWGTP